MSLLPYCCLIFALLLSSQERRSMVERTGQPHPLPMYMYRPGESEEDDEEEEDGEMDGEDDGEEPPMYEIDIRSVRVGSMRTQPEGPLLISLEGVCIKVRCKYVSCVCLKFLPARFLC